MSNTIVEVLKKAKSLIDSREKWTKGAYARTAEGRTVGAGQPDAACFCSTGAVSRACFELKRSGYIACVHLLGEEARPFYHMSDIVGYNDDPATTHGMVMEVFDKAIAKAEAISVTQSQSTETP